MPLFVRPGNGIKKEIASMPGNYQLSVDRLVEEVGAALDLGVRAFILFGIPAHKDASGSSALEDDGIVQQALRACGKQFGDRVLLMTDECFCEYTDHGHCGVLSEIDGPARSGQRRDAAEPGAAVRQPCPGRRRPGRRPAACSTAWSGPSAPASMRPASPHVPIMSYAAKYASGFYGPFRDAAESPPQFGDRSSYQMDPANGDEALREVALDLAEGADIIMVKPALAYLDIIRRVKERFGVPVAAYNVSGEFAMVKAAAQKGWIDERRVALEILTSIKRAGADMILTYFAPDAARWLK